MSGPVCLVRQEGEALVPCDDGLNLLRSLGNSPVACVAVAGLYRTGKSFFLNQLAGKSTQNVNESTGFKVGSTTESCTRGIWVYLVPESDWQCKQEVVSGVSPVRLLLFDTEGLASMDNDETYDAKVFSLGILISSYFVYNSMGVIDDTAIDRLLLVGEITKNICINGNEQTTSESDLSEYFPPFLWLLRDFSLELKKGDQVITTKEYLENALEERPGNSNRVVEHNRIRKSFKSLFKNRSCRTLVRPVYEESDLRRLNQLDKNSFRDEFVRELNSVTDSVLTNVRPKDICGEYISGQMLASLLEQYVIAINGGLVPDIKKSYDYVVEEKVKNALRESISLFSADLERGIDDGNLPGISKFEELCSISKKKSLEFFKANGVTTSVYHNETREVLETELESIRMKHQQELENKSDKLCRKLMKKLLDEKESRFSSLETIDVRDVEAIIKRKDDYFKAVKVMIRTYEKQSQGPCKAKVFAETMSRQGVNSILHFVETLVSSLQNNISEQVACSGKLENDLNIARTNLDHEKSSRLSDNLRNEEMIQQLKGELESTHEKLENTVQNANDTKAALQVAETSLLNLQGQLEHEQTSVSQERVEKAKLQDELISLTRDVSEKSKELENAFRRTNELIDHNEKLTNSLSTCQQQFEDCDKDRSVLMEQLENSQIECTSVKRELEESQVFIDEIAHHLNLVEEEITGQIMDRLTSEVEHNHMAEKITSMDKQIIRLTEERKALHEKLQDFFMRASTLPDFYQDIVFCTEAGLVNDW